jgi:hypothetical protein
MDLESEIIDPDGNKPFFTHVARYGGYRVRRLMKTVMSPKLLTLIGNWVIALALTALLALYLLKAL